MAVPPLSPAVLHDVFHRIDQLAALDPTIVLLLRRLVSAIVRTEKKRAAGPRPSRHGGRTRGFKKALHLVRSHTFSTTDRQLSATDRQQLRITVAREQLQALVATSPERLTMDDAIMARKAVAYADALLKALDTDEAA